MIHNSNLFDLYYKESIDTLGSILKRTSDTMENCENFDDIKLLKNNLQPLPLADFVLNMSSHIFENILARKLFQVRHISDSVELIRPTWFRYKTYLNIRCETQNTYRLIGNGNDIISFSKNIVDEIDIRFYNFLLSEVSELSVNHECVPNFLNIEKIINRQICDISNGGKPWIIISPFVYKLFFKSSFPFQRIPDFSDSVIHDVGILNNNIRVILNSSLCDSAPIMVGYNTGMFDSFYLNLILYPDIANIDRGVMEFITEYHYNNRSNKDEKSLSEHISLISFKE